MDRPHSTPTNQPGIAADLENCLNPEISLAPFFSDWTDLQKVNFPDFLISKPGAGRCSETAEGSFQTLTRGSHQPVDNCPAQKYKSLILGINSSRRQNPNSSAGSAQVRCERLPRVHLGCEWINFGISYWKTRYSEEELL